MSNANVTNHSDRPLGMPKGTVIEVGATALVTDWHLQSSHIVVKAWLDAGAISAEEVEEAETDDLGNFEYMNDQTKTPAEVLAMADGSFMAFKSAATKLLGDATPAKKAEIIAALEELATNPGA